MRFLLQWYLQWLSLTIYKIYRHKDHPFNIHLYLLALPCVSMATNKFKKMVLNLIITCMSNLLLCPLKHCFLLFTFPMEHNLTVFQSDQRGTITFFYNSIVSNREHLVHHWNGEKKVHVFPINIVISSR